MAGFAQEFPGEARSLPTVCCLVLERNANFRLSRPVRLSFGTQHHDWPGTVFAAARARTFSAHLVFS